ncbi:hypothetical protein AB0J90_19400 [Micromonospora sp. NPDC049523]|uniref:hypothetical protein n=1 Tax=Micromonospora sp. NPDC049523 TaxID=3155921 RepID=UPI00343CE8BA
MAEALTARTRSGRGSRTVIALSAVGVLVVLLVVGVLATVTHRALLAEPPVATDANVRGEWQGPDGAVLTLRPDHTFDTRRLPAQLTAPERFTRPWTGSGTWHLAEPDRYDVQSISVIVDSYALPLYLDRSQDSIRLYLWIGLPQEGKRYFLDRA